LKSKTSISVLLRDSGNSEAQAYVNDMIRNKLNFGYAGVKTGHHVVDAIANTKLSQCNAEQIRTTMNTSGFDLEMDDVDICIILGNLFDNAALVLQYAAYAGAGYKGSLMDFLTESEMQSSFTV